MPNYYEMLNISPMERARRPRSTARQRLPISKAKLAIVALSPDESRVFRDRLGALLDQAEQVLGS